MNYPKGLNYLHGKQLYMLLIDDGKGMNDTEMNEALVYGRRRSYEDYELGHFGVGLKNSTMSQAYEATILSKKDNKMNVVRISSVHIQGTGKDQLLVEDDLIKLYPWMCKTEGYKMAVTELNSKSSGTAILLEGLHKIERDIGKDVDRKQYLSDIRKKLRSQIGITFNRYISGGYKIKRTKGKDHQIKAVSISVNDIPVAALDPFYSQFTDTTSNHWTLQRKLFAKTMVGGEVKDLEGTAYIIPNMADIKTKSKAKNLNSKLMSLREELTRGELQGIYLFRHQRLIDYASQDPWKTLGKAHNDTVVGRWEIHLPPHAPNQLQDLDFTLDKTKTDTKIGKITREELGDFWSKDTYHWHRLDSSSVGTRKRMKFRTNRTEKQSMELQCTDCSLFGHSSKSSDSCIHHVRTIPVVTSPSGGSSSGKKSGLSSTTISGITGGSGTTDIKEVGVGDLTKVDGSKVKINSNHPLFNGVKDWFKQQP